MAKIQRWIEEGRIAWREAVAVGLENAPKTLHGLFGGANFAMLLLKFADPPFA